MVESRRDAVRQAFFFFFGDGDDESFAGRKEQKGAIEMRARKKRCKSKAKTHLGCIATGSRDDVRTREVYSGRKHGRVS